MTLLWDSGVFYSNDVREAQPMLKTMEKEGPSYWIPGSYVLGLSEKGDSFLRLLKNKGFREENMTKVGLYAIGTYTTLESNKSHARKPKSCKSRLPAGKGYGVASTMGLSWVRPPEVSLRKRMRSRALTSSTFFTVWSFFLPL